MAEDENEYQKLNKDGSLEGVEPSHNFPNSVQCTMDIDGETYGIKFVIDDDIEKVANMIARTMIQQYNKIKK